LVVYYDRTLQSVQSRYDFAPKYDSESIGIEPTGACKKVCSHLKEIVQVGSMTGQIENLAYFL
jgi:hypothetical protein